MLPDRRDARPLHHEQRVVEALVLRELGLRLRELRLVRGGRGRLVLGRRERRLVVGDRDLVVRDRLLRGTAVLRPQDDVFTNHIHADDLARACDLALWRTCPQRVVQVCDDTDLRMGDYYDLAADLYQLPRPQRLPRQAAEDALPLMLLSFMSESRRLEVENDRLDVERRAQSTPLRVEKLAREQLHMRTITPGITQYATLPGSAAATASSESRP